MTVGPDGQECAGCYFFRRGLESIGQLCMRYPPKADGADTNPLNWCGEWKQRETAA